MKQRFYFDTSVFGGVFDIEFDESTTLEIRLPKDIISYEDEATD